MVARWQEAQGTENARGSTENARGRERGHEGVDTKSENEKGEALLLLWGRIGSARQHVHLSAQTLTYNYSYIHILSCTTYETSRRMQVLPTHHFLYFKQGQAKISDG